MWSVVSLQRARRRTPLIMILCCVLIAGILTGTAAVAQTSNASPEKATAMQVKLPQTVGVWTLSQPAKRIDAKGIFDYMDGAGELYLGYRFAFLDVYEYESAKDDTILVELYWMQSSDDAYGLLSGDWGGEEVNLGPGDGGRTSPPRALYGSGLLRIWSDSLYARVMSYQETDASKQAVLTLGRAIISGRSDPAPPSLALALPANVGSRFTIRADRSVYLRSHLVLNSVYFLSAENLLDLSLDCELTAAPYVDSSAGNSQKQVRLLLARYPSATAAQNALRHFQKIYLSKKSGESATGDRGVVSIEDGWAGFILSGRGIGLVFESPDEPSTRLFLESSKQALEKLEAIHE